MNQIAPAALEPAIAAGSLCLGNARLVLPDRVETGWIAVEDGVIAATGSGAALPAGALDCRGDLVMPGLVELHTDNLERHIEPRPEVAWPHRPALLAHDGELASAGITTVFDALRVGSITSQGQGYGKYARSVADELIELRRAGAFRISHFVHLRAEICSETLLEELAEFGPGDRIGILSLMDHTPGQRQFRDISKLKAYWAGKRGFSDAAFDAHVAHLYALQERFGAANEAGAAAEAQRLGAVLASHDDTTPEQVAQSKGKGAAFAEFPTTAEAAAACREAGIAIMMGAPNIVRGGSHSGNVAALALAGDGLLDIVSSDYVPSSLLLAAFRLAAHWEDLPRAVRTVTEAPARAAGLADRGRLEPGQRADLLRVAGMGGQPVLRGVWSRGLQVG
ncbi:alpha-D-ribose 1-methylphosphonate 5-triphosphate diphosphatase [Poseidonocella sp. HB161398]|uniref:alpha-D-ribose 1-methylphosphonate 5-triphosphate diphosphatase n=1 Tax=Poseidonocella sp. HB161398 TaxID=2320855 RepID=UPI001108621C|nr:alpha-D-ribose 1-methylphosphonate 5-triphosphate diphosphatase [Poseidonocella sp. HB161398]